MEAIWYGPARHSKFNPQKRRPNSDRCLRDSFLRSHAQTAKANATYQDWFHELKPRMIGNEKHSLHDFHFSPRQPNQERICCRSTPLRLHEPSPFNSRKSGAILERWSPLQLLPYTAEFRPQTQIYTTEEVLWQVSRICHASEARTWFEKPPPNIHYLAMTWDKFRTKILKGFAMGSWKQDEILDFQLGRLPGLPLK